MEDSANAKQLTPDEAESFYNANPIESIAFESYYKYAFSFVGENDKMRLEVVVGGCAEDIYRKEIDVKPIPAPQTFTELVNKYEKLIISDKVTGSKFSQWETW